MAFTPDISLQDRDFYRERLVVGVDDDQDDLATRAAEIKAYMDKRNVQEGLLISPTHFRIYRNGLNEVTEVADLPTDRVMGRVPPHSEWRDWAEFVQRWLDRVQSGFYNGTVVLPPDVHRIIEREIIPELYRGETWLDLSRSNSVTP
ncbi:MAG TPA: hypothetical protein VKU19_06440 [Bryobacteraceae bacterium]|nr:hypothetical protein [Bryobacteraceae bacterium]